MAGNVLQPLGIGIGAFQPSRAPNVRNAPLSVIADARQRALRAGIKKVRRTEAQLQAVCYVGRGVARERAQASSRIQQERG
jgi:hypothetical protein